MASPLLLSDNFLNQRIYPGHIITADEVLAGHEEWRVGDGRRSALDYWSPSTAAVDHWVRSQNDQPRTADCSVLDRGHNWKGRVVQTQRGSDGSSWTTVHTSVIPQVPTVSGIDLTALDGVTTEEGAWLKAYSPVSDLYWRLLFKPQRNLLVRSAELGNASWVNGGGVTVTADVAVAPDLTVTADDLNFTTASSTNFIRQTVTIANPASKRYTFSLYVLDGSLSYAGDGIMFMLRRGDGSTDSQTGTFGNGLLKLDPNVLLIGGLTWRRLYFVYATSSSVTADIQVLIRSNAVTGNYRAWGAQLEERTGYSNDFPSLYIPTTNAQVTDPVLPGIVGAWIGNAWTPSAFFTPWSEDQADLDVAETVTEWGWRGRGPGAQVRSGALRYRFNTAAEYDQTARATLMQQYGRGRPMWICYDQTQADRAFLALMPRGAHLAPGLEPGWYPRQIQIPYLEHEPLRQ